MTETASGEYRDVVDVLTDDHREVEELFARARNVEEHKAFQDIVSQTIAELIRHSVAEEQYLYPALREHLENGNDIADHEIAEHAAAERLMKDMESLEASDPKLRALFNQLVEEINHHVEEEEHNALPRLRATCPPERLRELGTKVERAKAVAPTRPHPSAPDTPPMNKLLAPGAGLVDRVRDALTNRPT